MVVRSYVFIVNQESLTSLFDKLSLKVHKQYDGHHVGPGWLKYDYGDSVWDLNDGELVASWEHILMTNAVPFFQNRIIRFFRGDNSHT